MTKAKPKVTHVGIFTVESFWNQRTCSWATETYTYRTNLNRLPFMGTSVPSPQTCTESSARTAKQALLHHKWQVDSLRKLLPIP